MLPHYKFIEFQHFLINYSSFNIYGNVYTTLSQILRVSFFILSLSLSLSHLSLSFIFMTIISIIIIRHKFDLHRRDEEKENTEENTEDRIQQLRTYKKK